MNRSEQINELAAALAKAQSAMKNPKFDRINPAFRSPYASLAAIRDEVIPALSINNIAVLQSLRGTEAGVECETMLMHASGQWISDTLALPATKRDAQGLASVSTYCRRYGLQSMVCVVGDTDDDAEGDKGKPEPRKPSALTSEQQQYAATLTNAGTLTALKEAWKAIPAEHRAALQETASKARAAIEAAEKAATNE
jgi:hypothetical protein